MLQRILAACSCASSQSSTLRQMLADRSRQEQRGSGKSLDGDSKITQILIESSAQCGTSQQPHTSGHLSQASACAMTTTDVTFKPIHFQIQLRSLNDVGAYCPNEISLWAPKRRKESLPSMERTYFSRKCAIRMKC